jgi:hypothetical protein
MIYPRVGIELRFDLGLHDRQAMLHNNPRAAPETRIISLTHSQNLNRRLAGLRNYLETRYSNYPLRLRKVMV